MQEHDALRALRRLAARIGRDPALVQGAGGNVSIKLPGAMWIKASGTWLADAECSDIFVPVDESLAVCGPNPAGLRPSIETSLHAALPHAVVLHVHSVDAIAWAVRTDAAALLADRLAGLPWALVSYRQPGSALTAALREAMAPGTDVFILANHGLVVAADDVPAAEALLRDVVRRLAIVPRKAPEVRTHPSAQAGFRPVDDPFVHSLATDPASLAVAAAGVLYPDHVVFLGPEPLMIDGDADLGAALRRVVPNQLPPRWLIVRGRGVLIADDVARGGEEMLRCLADVAARIPAGTNLNVLTADEVAALVDWEAEHYRQRLAHAAPRATRVACA